MVKPEHKIGTFLHCRSCVDELPEDQTPQDFVKLECGLTETGFAIQCVRHKVTVMAFTPEDLHSILAARASGELECEHCGDVDIHAKEPDWELK